MIIPSRRRFLFGAATFLAAPAIVRISNIMPVSVPKPALYNCRVVADAESVLLTPKAPFWLTRQEYYELSWERPA